MARYSKPRFAYEAELRSLHAQGYSDSEIGEAVGRSHAAVGIHRRRLGLSSNRFHQRYRSRASEYAKRRLDRGSAQPVCVLHWRNTQRSFAIRNGWPEDLCPREVTILNALLSGPMNRMQICAAIGLRWRGGTRSLRCTPGGTYMARLMRRGLVVSLGKVNNFTVYALGLAIEPIPVAERMLA